MFGLEVPPFELPVQFRDRLQRRSAFRLFLLRTAPSYRHYKIQHSVPDWEFEVLENKVIWHGLKCVSTARDNRQRGTNQIAVYQFVQAHDIQHHPLEVYYQPGTDTSTLYVRILFSAIRPM